MLRPDRLVSRPPRRSEQRAFLALQPPDLDVPEGSVTLRPPQRLFRRAHWALRLVKRAGRSGFPLFRRALTGAGLPGRDAVFLNELLQDPEQRAPFQLGAARRASLMIVEDLGELRQRGVGGGTDEGKELLPSHHPSSVWATSRRRAAFSDSV